MVIDQTKNRRQFLVLLQDLSSWCFSLFLSFLACLVILLWLPKNTAGQWIFAGSVLALATTVLMFVVHWLIFQYIKLRLYTTKYWKIGLVGIALLAGMWLSLNIFIITPPANLTPTASPYLQKLAYRASIGSAFGLVLLWASTWLATAIPNIGQAAAKNSLLGPAIKYIIPMGLVWGIYLLAFYPAMMSADSMNQWEQVLTGKFIDHHPAFHTFLIWLVTRMSLSPTIVAIAQIIALAFVAGLWLAFFETLGIRRWVIGLTAFIFAVVPVNGTMVNTLWKDVPYSTAVLGLTLIIARVIVTKGKWVATISAQIILGLTVALVMLLRHDGVVLGAGTLLILLLAYPKRWKAWLATLLVSAFLYFGMRGPVYRWVGVEKPDTYTSASLSLYSIAAYTTPGSATDRFVSSILLTSSAWNCNIWTNITPEMLKTDVNQAISMPQTIANLLRHIPNLFSYDVRCARSMEWIVWDPNGEVRNTSHAEVWIDPNPFGIQPDSKIPALREWLSDWVVRTAYNPNQNWYIWRPAIFTYLYLFLVGVLILRNRDLRFGLLAVPTLIQSISFSLILAEPNFRYHYAVYLVALISIPLFFSPSITEQVEPSEASRQQSKA